MLSLPGNIQLRLAHESSFSKYKVFAVFSGISLQKEFEVVKNLFFYVRRKLTQADRLLKSFFSRHAILCCTTDRSYIDINR